VFDEKDEPVEGAEVSVLKQTYRAGKKQWTEIAKAKTLDNGEYRVPRLASGRYLVRAVRKDLAADVGFAPTYFPGVTEQQSATAVTADAGKESRGIDIRLRRTPLFHVRGKVVLPCQPCQYAAAGLSLISREDGSTRVASAFAVAPAFLFDIGLVQPGSYILIAESPRPAVFTVQPIEVVSSDVDAVLLNLTLTPEVRGVVKVEDSSVPVNLTTARVILNAVELTWEGKVPDDPAGTPLPNAFVGRDGRFAITLFSRLFVRFGVEVAKLPENVFVRSIRYDGRPVPDSGVELVAGAELEIVVGTGAGIVNGSVTDRDGKPVTNAVVALIGKDQRAHLIQSDREGRFEIKQLAPEEYRVLAFEDVERGALEDPEFVRRFDSRAVVVSVAPGGRASVVAQAIPSEGTISR